VRARPAKRRPADLGQVVEAHCQGTLSASMLAYTEESIRSMKAVFAPPTTGYTPEQLDKGEPPMGPMLLGSRERYPSISFLMRRSQTNV
jgi:hypothetical protein